MKLTIMLLTITLVIGASGYAQSVTFTGKDVSLQKVFAVIKQQTGYSVFYNKGLLDGNSQVTVTAKEMPLKDFMSLVLARQPLNFRIEDKSIILSEKPPQRSMPAITQQLPAPALAQTAGIRVTGTVTNIDGEPMAGVSVKIKGASQGAVLSDNAGKYSIVVPDTKAVLVFNYLGYAVQEAHVGNNTVLNLKLINQPNDLNDIVIVGYGSSTRKDLTGAISSVKMGDLAKAPVKSFDDALGGRVAGVQVTSFDGQPGGGTSIVIRGSGSVTQDNSPLYVIDGFPIENNDNNTLNPQDIESIDILKDASATAIYGARGANGVIIITTKRGKLGAPVVNYNYYYGIQRDINRLQVLSPYEFVKLQLEIAPTTFGAQYTSQIGKTLEDYRNVQGIDWYGKIFRTASQQNHNVSVSGGSDKTKYSLSASILDQQGIIINSAYKRYQGRFTLDQTVSKKLKVGITTNFSNAKDNGLIVNGGGGSTSYMWTVWGYRPVQADPSVDIEEELLDPNIGNAPVRTNPFLQAQNELRDNTVNTLLANSYADLNITKELKLRVTGGMNLSLGERDAFNNSKTRAGSTLVGSLLGINGSEAYSTIMDLSNENTLSYSKKIGKHSLNAVVGYTVQTRASSSFYAQAKYVPNEELGVSGLDEGTPNKITSRKVRWGAQSLLARINYGYRLFNLTASFRADGSSKFPVNNRWGYFPSAAMAYRLSDAKFMRKLSFISNAKIRIGYGATGNNRVDEFAYVPSMNFDANYYSFGNASPSQGAVLSSLGNPKLKWEKIEQTNLGLDISFFNERVSLTVDFYNKVTRDLLLNAALPTSTGYNTAFKNIGKVGNKGVEFTVNTLNINRPEFKWSTDFNISFNRNKILALSENQEAITSTLNSVNSAYYIAKLGRPIAMFYGVIFDGVYQYSDFNKLTNGTYVLKDEVTSNSTAALRGSIRPGDIKFKDLNNDGIINNYDFTVIGNPNPDFIGGISNNFQYKGFDLNMFFQFVYGNQVMNANILQMELGNSPNTNQYASFAHRWSPTNPSNTIPRAGGSTTNFNHSRPLEDGSFLRFKTAALGYTLPTKWLSKISVKSLRAYISAQNLFVLTNYSGSDPEVSTRNSPLTPGYDYSAYPHTRTFVAGFSVNF
jgi:TonB-linked SusC/RagA family outer membrane protein